LIRNPLNPPAGLAGPLKWNSKIFLILVIILFNTNLFSQSEIRNSESVIEELQSYIDKLIDNPFFDRSTIAIDIFDLTDGEPLFRHNNKLLLHPASNMKILTSIAGLMNLGEYYTFRTDLFHTGVIANDTLYGDIIVAGGFDPDFTTEDLDSLVRIVKSLGISYITGGIYADVSKKDSLYWGEGWMWDDDPAPSAPYLSALNINDNSIEVFVEGTEVDSAARVHLIPETDFISVENNSKTVSAIHPNKFSINRDWVGRKNKIIIDGEVRNASLIDTADHKEKINLLFPEKYFITLFNEHLEKEGIYVQKRYEVKKLPDNAVYLNSIYRPIDTVLSDLNKESDNLNAEMIIYAIAYKDSGAPAYAKDGLAAIYRLIDSLGLNSDEYYIADGSGISHYNLITAELLVEMLKYIYYKSKDLFELFYNSLSIAGIDGTLEKRMWNTYAEGNVHGKTGTLMGVSTLSGYVTAKNGNLIAFSILIQNFVDRYSVARRFQDRICALLSELE
jgi:D-alanyl-D-alanine carboxypeptidase/D-alanyl-D-alanine-endopeptidase (penicillin-binding protein 4)